MKKITYILIAFVSLFFAGCENDPDLHSFPPPEVDFAYSIDGEYALDFIIGSKIVFENKSISKGDISWDFGDGEKSNDPQPIHQFNKPGNYEVTLNVGTKSIKKNILISDMKNIVSYKSSESPSIIESSVIEIDIELPNPGEFPATFTWEFPEGTTDENGVVVKTSNQHNPGKLRFKNVGSQQLTLKTTIYPEDEDPRELDAEQVNIQIGYSQPAKTIYFAGKDGYLRALKIINDLPSGIENKPFTLKASAGQHAFNILFHDSLLYVLDAGKQFYYINDENQNLGDGRISVISKDGNNVESMASNVGKAAFDDPFYGYIDKTSKTLYFSDRNTGVRKLSLDTRNATISDVAFWVQNATLGYYQNGIVYGAGNGSIQKVGDTWWWGKYFGSLGIFRFKESDILPAPTTGGLPSPTSGIALANKVVRSFAIDEARSMLYAAILSPSELSGFYAIPLSELEDISNATLLTKRIAALTTDAEGTDAEKVFITQIAIDEEDGSAYFGYRQPSGTSVEKSGLKRYNPATKKLETLVEGIEIYGVAINDNKSKLF